jgi:hypothetical protein
MATVEERQQWRESFLVALYERLGDNTLDRAHYSEIAAAAGAPESDAQTVADWNVKEGYAEWPVIGGFIAITHRGINEAERLIGAGVRTSIPLVLSAEEQADLEVVIASVQKAVDSGDLPLDRETQAELDADLESATAQLRSPRPSRRIVRAALEGVAAIVAAAAGNALFVGIEALLRKL